MVTAGADGTVRTLDPRLGFALCGTVRLTNFPYSMTAAGGLAVVGCGDGSIHFIDIQVRLRCSVVLCVILRKAQAKFVCV